jgi:hypothetical protein
MKLEIGLLMIGCMAMSQYVFAQDTHIEFQNRPYDTEDYALQTFLVAKINGSIIVHGTCSATASGDEIITPRIPATSNLQFDNVAEALGELARIDADILWLQDQNNIWRVYDKRVNNDIFNIRIQNLKFNHSATSGIALQVVLNAPEIKEYMKQNNYIEGLVVYPLSPIGDAGTSKLTNTLHNVTFREALDYVMKHYSGIWIYDECLDGKSTRILLRGYSYGSDKHQ